MDRYGIYQHILANLEDTYKRKNNDYGNSVGDTYDKFGDISFLTRITDKYNRILSLADKGECGEVKDEAIEDTILDLANYCLLWLVERDYKKEQTDNKPSRTIAVETNRPVSNYDEVSSLILEDVQNKLKTMSSDEITSVINVLDHCGARYELRPGGIVKDRVKLVLAVEDITLLQQIIKNLGI